MKTTLDQIKQSLPGSDRHNPSVSILLELLEQHIATITLRKEQIQQLKDEIARLKKQKPKPKISPGNLSEKGKEKKSGKRPGSAEKKKTANLEIHKTERIKPESIPPGSTFNGLKSYTVQGLKISVHNTRYLLEQWMTPDGKIISGQPPPEIDGHFDNTLKTFILHQYHHCHVTQPLLLEQLREWGADISSGQLNNILTEKKDSFHDEKDAILSAGLQSSPYVNVDDTGARHNGKNGYCTHIGNDFFAWFESTESKSRINFLSLLRAGASDYLLNEDAFEYMKQKRLPKSPSALLLNHPAEEFMDAEQWEQHLKESGIVKPRRIQIATEGALFACVLSQLPGSLVIVSDDAGQFNILNHALCRIHAERTSAEIIAPGDEKRQILEEVREQIRQFYSELKVYKESPSQKEKNRLSEKFDTIFTRKTDFETLNSALQRLYKNKSELLSVLDRPEIPLHNNLSENDIREYVKRRKVSGSTRNEAGRRCRDTFTSIKKTCRKSGISFWQYIEDRLSGKNAIPPLSHIIEQASTAPG